jgi:hypothetical protein
VGLGASAVLITQSFLSPGPAPASAPGGDPSIAPLAPPAAAPAARTKSADPILSRNPFDSKRGPINPRSI